MASGHRGLTICVMPLSIKNLNTKVETMHQKLSWKSSWNMDLISSKDVHSSITCSSLKSLMVFFNHLQQFVWPLFESVFINSWPFRSLVLVMNGLDEFLKFSRDGFKEFSWISMKIFVLACVRVNLFLLNLSLT